MCRRIIIIIFIVILVVSISVNGVYFIENKTSVKTAISRNNLAKDNYIICKAVLVTGYYWQVIENETGTITPIYCVITGVDPQKSLSLKYEFMSANNKFVFYPTQRKEYYSEVLKENVVEYIVNGWDILYPVRHGSIKDIIPLSWHITTSDCN